MIELYIYIIYIWIIYMVWFEEKYVFFQVFFLFQSPLSQWTLYQTPIRRWVPLRLPNSEKRMVVKLKLLRSFQTQIVSRLSKVWSFQPVLWPLPHNVDPISSSRFDIFNNHRDLHRNIYTHKRSIVKTFITWNLFSSCRIKTTCTACSPILRNSKNIYSKCHTGYVSDDVE